jgi:ribosomal protein S18 acetylase RimI-like enzyme
MVRELATDDPLESSGRGDSVGAVEIISVGRREVARLRDAVVAIYARAWASTSFHQDAQDAENFGDRLLHHGGNPDFRLCVAFDGDSPIGFSYGYASVPGGWWRQTIAVKLPVDVAKTWLDDCFEFAELAVLPQRQNSGVGGRLHDALVADLPHRTSLLSTQKSNEPALRFYERRGWKVLNESMTFPNRSDPYVIMGLDLKGRAQGTASSTQSRRSRG